MKKLLLMMLVLVMSVGCLMQSEHKKDDAYELAKITATGHIENVLGYDPESDYLLHKIIKRNQDEYPYMYQVTKDKEAVLYIEFDYSTEMRYGGICFDYKEGHLTPTVKDQYVRTFDPDEYLYSVSLNHEMNYKDYTDVVVHHLDVNRDQEVMDRVINYLSNSDSLLPDGVECHEGDLVQLGSPIPYYRIELNEENETIEVNQLGGLDYPVYINNELKCIAAPFFSEEGFSFGFRNIEDYPLLLTNEKYISVATGGAYYQNFFVTENGVSNPEIKYPLYVEKALKSIQSIVKDLESSTKIVVEQYIELKVLTAENSLNPEAYRVAEEFISNDYDGTVKIVDEDILYDPDYNELGYNFSLSYPGGAGHAVVIKKGSSYIVNEASYGGNPYEGLSKDVIKVYAGPFGYLFYLENGMLMDLRTNEEVDPANVRRYKTTSDN